MGLWHVHWFTGTLSLGALLLSDGNGTYHVAGSITDYVGPHLHSCLPHTLTAHTSTPPSLTNSHTYSLPTPPPFLPSLFIHTHSPTPPPLHPSLTHRLSSLLPSFIVWLSTLLICRERQQLTIQTQHQDFRQILITVHTPITAVSWGLVLHICMYVSLWLWVADVAYRDFKCVSKTLVGITCHVHVQVVNLKCLYEH